MLTQRQQLRADLTALREFFSVPGRWTYGTAVRDARGRGLDDVHDPRAVRFCVVGGINHEIDTSDLSGLNRRISVENALIHTLMDRIRDGSYMLPPGQYVASVVQFNDRLRSVKPLLALIDETLEGLVG